jgi:hypothetical protein
MGMGSGDRNRGVSDKKRVTRQSKREKRGMRETQDIEGEMKGGEEK